MGNTPILQYSITLHSLFSTFRVPSYDMPGKLEHLTISCMRCGYCKPVCPVFQEIGEEAASPRGRVRLIRGVSSKEIKLSPRYQELIAKCINCRACADECPSGVEPNIAVLNARHHLMLKKGLPLIKRLIFRRALRARRMFPASAKLMGLLQRASFIGSPYSPARLILPFLGLPVDKALPYFQLQTFLDRTPEINPAENRRYRVAYFVGCAANLLFPEIGEAVIGLLNRCGAEVVVPRGQMCCGTPVFNAGDFEGGVYLAEQNLRAFADLEVDAIITACGSCGLALKQEWRNLLSIRVPEGFAGKVYDFAEFLTDHAGIADLAPLIPKSAARNQRSAVVTYHDPCHLARGMLVREQPRKLLASLPGVDLVEMAEADRCCGGGGAFSLYYPDLSRQIGVRKAVDSASTGAGLVATGCPSCLMQLREMLTLAHHRQVVSHTACVLWNTIRAGQPAAGNQPSVAEPS